MHSAKVLLMLFGEAEASLWSCNIPKQISTIFEYDFCKDERSGRGATKKLDDKESVGLLQP